MDKENEPESFMESLLVQEENQEKSPPAWLAVSTVLIGISNIALGIYRYFLMFGMAFHATKNDRIAYGIVSFLGWILNPIGALLWKLWDEDKIEWQTLALGYLSGCFMWPIVIAIIWTYRQRKVESDVQQKGKQNG